MSDVPQTQPAPPPPPPPQAPKRRRLGPLILAIVVILLIVLVIVHIMRNKKTEHGAAPQVVTVAAATLGPMPVTLNALGTVTPVATVTVLPQISGYLTEVGYKEGQDVVKGQFLAQIDPRQYEISKEQALAQLAKDQALLAQARADLARYTQLNAKQSIAAQTYSDQQFLVKQYEAAVQADKANVRLFELDLIYCRITAPVSGRVGLRLVDPGNYVTSSSSTGIAVITTIKPTTVQFAIPQTSLGSVLERVNAGAKLPITVFSSDNTRQIATGTLFALSNQMATATGTVTLRASVPNDNEALFPNEFVNVRLLVDTLQSAVLVPTPAVQTGAPGDYVYLVNADNTVSVHKVTLGPSDGRYTVISAGLQQGQHVVTDGLDRLNDGAKIQPAGPRPATHAGAASGAGGASAPHPGHASGAASAASEPGATAPNASDASAAASQAG
ncbi:efflux RND transporter periplasmic adaptor subunit [Paraburkholderia sp. CNPSo 3281]|uniref:efflux RND transporter periplasmic adaptor subunit n=1 Tax=Paraburkholderia sp. CNPSo 3281 TaxID=2940933 RepID=UPI0020B8F10B|nr:efflux RND transporter periplasmic adaptor subunit [Paraburkholderia sp. CNPSo 3281]MCP3720394.1 efflux RND transporter periplasmic adaptor subunit [Paraburkholderia sp. CNPSo 3281]